ncbi:MAG: VCBS repeat-containing protein [Planctomycetota bacterium]
MCTENRLWMLGGLALGLVACSKEKPVETTQTHTPTVIPTQVGRTGSAAANTDPIAFHYAPGNLGVDFVHTSGMDGRKLLPETMGGGVCLFDMDQDGDLDLYLSSGKSWDPKAAPTVGRLYAMEEGRFVDRTEAAGLAGEGFNVVAQGVIAADYDADGDEDLFPDLFWREHVAAQRWRTVCRCGGSGGARGAHLEGRERRRTAGMEHECGFLRPRWRRLARPLCVQLSRVVRGQQRGLHPVG